MKCWTPKAAIALSSVLVQGIPLTCRVALKSTMGTCRSSELVGDVIGFDTRDDSITAPVFEPVGGNSTAVLFCQEDGPIG